MVTNKLSYIFVFIAALFAGLAMLIHEIWFVLVALAAGMIFLFVKPKTEKENEEVKEFSENIFAWSVLIPLIILFFIIVTGSIFIIITR